VLWSDFSVVSLKRWIKEVGTLVMVLVVLSDPNHDEAVKTVFRRCAYVLLPLSVLFIKYYPDLGRAYSPWTGEVGYSGVTVGKNSLGVLCLIFGMFFVWNFVTSSSKKGIAADKQRLLIHAIILIMIFWLFAKANSATSLVCFIIGVCMIVGSRMRILRANPRSFVRYVMVAGLIVFAFVTILDMSKTLVLNLGRDETLTGRTDLWRELVKVDINPFIGTGYESFWLGDRAAKLWQKYSFHPNQSHNGYLETYLNLGVMGLFLLAGVVVSAYRKIRQGLELDFDFGAFCLALLIIILLHNITEASFQGLSLMWFVFLLIGMEVPKPSGLQSSGFPV
jgi:O-antigen ligase